ncbi:MAG: GntR family transcriptional regulator [Pseudomonadota bacterium]
MIQNATAEPTQAAKIAEEIQTIILNGELGPGDGLNEQALADRFGVSRTPIREALRMLAASGVVRQEPRKRARVAEMPLGRVFEYLEALSEIEASCARLSARRMTPIERANLAETHDAFCQALRTDAEDMVTTGAIGLQFHERLVLGCHNSALIEIAKAAAARVLVYRAQQAFKPGRLEKSAQEHGDILKAVQQGDDELTYKLMRGHFEVVSANVSDIITSAKNATASQS